MAQPCKPCKLKEVRDLDAELVAGTVAIAELAQKYRLSESSVRRHKANHTAESILNGPHADETTGVVDLFERLVGVLKGAERVHQAAIVGNRPAQALAAGKEIRATATELLDRLGVDYESTLADLRSADKFILAQGRMIRQHPKLGPVLADQLDSDGHASEAETIRSFARTAQAALDQRNAS